MHDLIFSPQAFKEYLEWLTEDKKIFKKINDLIKDIQRNGFSTGVGKPEPLKHIKAYSRRIDETNRLVYTGDEKQNLRILSCKGHYI
jgi:toxin YoeB